jgi:Fur family transcriptional regulator, ferric uptake regulator
VSSSPVNPDPVSPEPVNPATQVFVEGVLDALRRSGGRVTSTRRATVEALLSDADRHLSAEQIVAAVRQRHPDVAESTVYRTLSTLEELGIVAHMHLDHGPATFHLAGRRHRHLVCRGCQAVVEMPADLYTDLATEVERRYGFVVEDEHFALSGRCPACRGAAAQAAGPR